MSIILRQNMLINIAKAQQAEVGDGTTTATIMAGGLVGEGVGQVMRGVPVARVIEGVRYGIARALEAIREREMKITDMADPVLRNIAMIAGREHEDIAGFGGAGRPIDWPGKTARISF